MVFFLYFSRSHTIQLHMLSDVFTIFAISQVEDWAAFRWMRQGKKTTEMSVFSVRCRNIWFLISHTGAALLLLLLMTMSQWMNMLCFVNMCVLDDGTGKYDWFHDKSRDAWSIHNTLTQENTQTHIQIHIHRQTTDHTNRENGGKREGEVRQKHQQNGMEVWWRILFSYSFAQRVQNNMIFICLCRNEGRMRGR